MTYDGMILLGAAARDRRIDELRELVQVFHADKPRDLMKALTREKTFTRTGLGRQGMTSGGGIRLGDLMKFLGTPKVQFMPKGAIKRGN